MKLLICTILFLLFVGNLFAQLGDRFYGQSVFHEIQPSGDGNFYVVGTKDKTKAWLLKLDMNKNIIWEKTYSGPSGEYVTANHLMIDSTGNMLLVGAINYDLNGFDQSGWAMKIDKLGNEVWSKRYGNGISIYHCCLNGVGGYYLGSLSAQGGSLININSDGTLAAKNPVVYIKIYDGARIKYLELNPDSTLTIIGRAETIGTGFQGIFFTRVKPNGTRIITTTYDCGTGENYERSINYSHTMGIVKKPNGNYVITDALNYSDCFLMELDGNGTILSNKIYSDPAATETPYGLMLLPDGDFLINGETREQVNGEYLSDPFIARVSTNGYEKWKKYYKRGLQNARVFNGVLLDDKSILFCGIAQDTLAYIFTIDGDGNYQKYSIFGNVFYDVNSNCIKDSTDYSMPNILIKKKNGIGVLSSADSIGNFILKTDDLINNLTALAPNEYGKFCEDEKEIIIDTLTNSASVQFLLGSVDSCSHIRVHITQPDLIRCKKSKYQVFVKNVGGIPSEPQELIIEYDKALSIIEYTQGGKHVFNSLNYDISTLKPNEELMIEFIAELTCDAFIGASHLVIAKILSRDCQVSRAGSELEINQKCLGDKVRFTINNISDLEMKNVAYYQVYADQYLIDEETFQLQAKESFKLEFETKGKTIHIEVSDPNAILSPGKNIYATIEGCGNDKNNIYSTTFANAYRPLRQEENTSVALASNSTGIPDKVHEMIEGLGYYHLINENDWLEFTLRTRNPFEREINQVEFQLDLNNSINISTFQLLGSASEAQIFPLDENRLRIKFNKINLGPSSSETNADLFLKFRVRPFDNIPPDSTDSYFEIGAKVFYGGEGPYRIGRSWHNYTHSIPYKEKDEEKYTEEISLFGGRYTDFGAKIANGSDGSVYLLIHSTSFNDNKGYECLVIKLDNQSKVVWYSVLPLKRGYYFFLEDIVALNDGTCIILGYSVRNGYDGTLHNSEIMLAKVGTQGELLFEKYYNPNIGQGGAQANDITVAKDGNYLICGRSYISDGSDADHFIMKIDTLGNQLWFKTYIDKTTYYEAMNVFELQNGDIICGGFYGFGGGTLFVQKTDSVGNSRWLKSARPSLCDYNYVYRPAITLTKKEEIIFQLNTPWQDPVTSKSFSSPHFTKFDKNGKYLFEKRPIIDSSARYDPVNKRIAQDDNGNFYIIGEMYRWNVKFDDDAVVAKLDSNFNMVWYKYFGSNNDEAFTDLSISSDNNIHLIGYNQERPPDYNLQTLYLKTDLNGDLVSSQNVIETANNILVFPNPAKNKINVFFFDDSKIKNSLWALIDLNGQIIKTGNIQSQKFSIDVQDISQGMYLLRFTNLNIPMQKIIVQH